LGVVVRAGGPFSASHVKVIVRYLSGIALAVLFAVSVISSRAAERPFPAEHGRLRVEGTHFYDGDNQIWRWRGATQFLLFARYLNGEDITPQLEWLVTRGFNVLRIFGEVPSGFHAKDYGVDNYERPFERPDFEKKLHAFFTLLESRGLRCEYTVLTYWDASDVMRSHLQRVFDVAASHWNVFVEVANEPEHNRIDPVAVMQGVNRRGVLTAYGLDPLRSGNTADVWTGVPVLDYGTTHDLQRDLEHSPIVTRSAMELQNALGVPFVNDEPIGAIDPGHKLFKQTGPEMWGGIGGGGARTVNRNVFTSAAAIAYMYSAGYTFHFQDGVEGRVPSPAHRLQDDAAAALRDIATFIPNDVLRGMPVQSTIGSATAFGVVLDNRQWAVLPAVPPDWKPGAPAGWRVDAVGPAGNIVRLIK
jgi:hypothetical protein